MSEFEKYIEAKYPNRSPKILFQKFKDIDGTVFYAVREIEDQAEVWSHQQAKIDDSENTRAVLYRENTDIREKNTDLQAKIDELKAKNEKTQKQFNFLLDKNIRDESAHATLKLKFMEVSRLVRSLRGEFDLWSDSPPVERQIELLEEIMRGGHE